MKKILLILFTVSLNTFLFSCTAEDLAETMSIHETQASETGGEDGQTPDEEEDDGN